jgi:hypothetical protein
LAEPSATTIAQLVQSFAIDGRCFVSKTFSGKANTAGIWGNKA